MNVRGPVRLVAVLFAICFVFEARFVYDSLRNEIHIAEEARWPFTLKSPGASLQGLKPEAKEAGLAEGDSSVAINGRPVRGMSVLARELRNLHPGDTVEVSAIRQGAPIQATVRLTNDSITTSQWVLAAFLYYLTPWFCIVLGFSVLFLRPRDPLAWLLLLLMLSFAETAQGDGFTSTFLAWNDWMRPVAMFFHSLLVATWGLWMMLFGQYFPNRTANGRWDRVTRWGIGLPLAAMAVVTAMVNVVAMDDATAIPGIQSALNRLGPVLMALMMAGTSLFFVNISRKLAKATVPEERRRFKLLYGGTTVALTPLFLLVVASLILRRPIGGSNWMIYPALVLLFVFPLTLAYVIVVEKAMELRVAIRTGLQYALASKGVRVVQVAVSAGVLVGTVYMATGGGVRRAQQMQMIAYGILFVMLSRRVASRLQKWIDHRFFREAVDTERVLSELGDNVRTIMEMKPLLATVTNTISSTLHVPRVAALVRQNGDYTPAHALGFGSTPLVRFSAKDVVAERLGRSRDALRVSLTRSDSWVHGIEEHKQLETLETELLLPLAVKDRLLGFLSLGPKLSEEPYSPTDVRLLQSVAAQTGLALENSRLTEAVASEVAQRERLNRELEIAREVQQRLFPQSGPEMPGLDYAGKCRPASSVGGDYYDFVAMCDGRLGIAIGDISGKGVPAALLMASLQASLRGLAIANPPALSSLMVNLNHLIYDASPSNRYATFFYGVYNPTTREFQYVNGGHNPPMVFRGNEVLRLEVGGPVVGLFGPAEYSQSSIQFQSGDTMVLFTDGVSEAMNGADEEFDEPRLMEAVRSGAGLKATELIDHIMRECDGFVSGAPQHDDMTLVVVRVE